MCTGPRQAHTLFPVQPNTQTTENGLQTFPSLTSPSAGDLICSATDHPFSEPFHWPDLSPLQTSTRPPVNAHCRQREYLPPRSPQQ